MSHFVCKYLSLPRLHSSRSHAGLSQAYVNKQCYATSLLCLPHYVSALSFWMQAAVQRYYIHVGTGFGFLTCSGFVGRHPIIVEKP